MTKDAKSMDQLEERIALMLCQHNRITRDMPSLAELQKAMPWARSIINEVRKTIK